MLPSSPNSSRPKLNPTPQLLCSQDFARNPFGFIDLAGTLSTQPNRFIDLREFACFFQEQSMSKPLPKHHPNVRNCTHIKVTGQRCGSPALRGEFFCYFHTRVIKGVQQRVDMQLHSMALLEDCESIQLSIMHVVDGLIKGTLDPTRARLIIQALRIAARNAKNVRFDTKRESEKQSMVREVPDYAQQYLIEHPEFGSPLNQTSSVVKIEAQAEPQSSEQNASQGIATAYPAPKRKGPTSEKSPATEPAAKRRKNTAHGASRGTEAENNPAPKERKKPQRDLKELERVQAAIAGAERGNWRDLRTVFEFAGICQPNVGHQNEG